MEGISIQWSLGLIFIKYHIYLRVLSSSFPAVEDKIFGYGRQRPYPATAVGLFRYYKEATDRGAFY